MIRVGSREARRQGARPASPDERAVAGWMHGCMRLWCYSLRTTGPVPLRRTNRPAEAEEEEEEEEEGDDGDDDDDDDDDDDGTGRISQREIFASADASCCEAT